jgi:hypothetical protein
MHQIRLFALASVLSVQVGALPSVCVSKKPLEPKLQQVLAASLRPRYSDPPGWESFGCFE